MQIILQEDVEKLGTRGQVVDVAEGYARNFLLPRKLALEATPGNMKRLEKMRATFAKKEATEKGDAQTARRTAGRRFARRLRAKPAKTTSSSAPSLRRYFRSARSPGLHNREAEDRAGRSNQDHRRIRNSGQAAPRSNRHRESGRQERRVTRFVRASF